MYYRSGKRLLNLATTTPALIILLPVLALVTLLVRIRLGLPVLFRQRRPGLHGKPFTTHKFRTMTDASDARGNLSQHSSWITAPSAVDFGGDGGIIKLVM